MQPEPEWEKSMLGHSKIVAFAPAKDLRQARKFYEGVLGLRFVSEDPFAAVFDVTCPPKFNPDRS
jgi:hypothetical protein